MIRMMSSLTLLVIGGALLGCSSQPASAPADVQTKEQDAKEKMKDAYTTDPTLQKPGSGNAPPGGGTTPVLPPGSGR